MLSLIGRQRDRLLGFNANNLVIWNGPGSQVDFIESNPVAVAQRVDGIDLAGIQTISRIPYSKKR